MASTPPTPETPETPPPKKVLGIDEYELQQALALAIDRVPGFHDGLAHPWAVAGKAIEAIHAVAHKSEE